MENKIENARSKIVGAVLGAAFAASTVLPEIAQAQQVREHVTIGEYCEIQQGNLVSSLQDYTPYRAGDTVVNIPVSSSVHGDITLGDVDCVTLPPLCSNRTFIVTPAFMVSAHAGLGSLNQIDTPSQRRAYEVLANMPPRPVSANDSDVIAAVDHLRNYHGMDLLRVENNRFVPGQAYLDIAQACSAKLNME